MTSSSEQALNSVKIHKVPSFEVWGEQYGETNGIGENDVVIMSPESWKKDFQGKVYTIGIGDDNDIVIPQNYQVDFSTTYSEYITQNTVFVLKNNSENWTFTLPPVLESSNPNFGREITFICNDGLGEHTVSIKGYGNIGSGVGQFDIFIPISTDSSTYQLTQNNICLKIKEVECEENFLGTDRTRGSWAILRTSDIPSQSEKSGKFLTTDGTNTSWGVPVPPWGSTISTNRTLSEADNGKMFACITRDLTITIPFSPEPEFSSGFEVEIVNWGGHNITITPAPAPTEGEDGVTINNSSNSVYLNTRYTSIKLKLVNRGNRTWYIDSNIPSQSGKKGKFLTTDGTTMSWGSVFYDITVTISGSTITSTDDSTTILTAFNNGKNLRLYDSTNKIYANFIQRINSAFYFSATILSGSGVSTTATLHQYEFKEVSGVQQKNYYTKTL